MADKDTNITALTKQAEIIKTERKQHANTAERIGSMFLAIIEFLRSYTVESFKNFFLSKTSDDRSSGTIASDKGFEAGTYVPGSSGTAIYQDEDGSWHIETDHVSVRRKFTAQEIEVMHTSHIGGHLLNTAARITVTDVVQDESGNYVCHFNTTDTDGRTVNNMFAEGDQAICETFNLSRQANGGVGNHYLWRLVTAVTSNSITLSAIDCAENSDEPREGDVLVQLGSRTDTSRQGAIIQAATGDGAPYMRIYKGINSYTLPTPKVNLSPEEVNIMADSITLTSGGKQTSLNDSISALQNSINTLDAKMEDVHQQADREYTLWFFPYTPTTDNQPASDWGNNDTRALHLQDLFYNTESGHAWRWEEDSNEPLGYAWHDVTDHQTVKALENAAAAQETADGKRRVFVEQPTDADTYDVGDLWSGATWNNDDGSILYQDDLLVCRTAKAKGKVFDINHWQPSNHITYTVFRQLSDKIVMAAGTAGNAEALAKKAESDASAAHTAATSALNAAATANEGNKDTRTSLTLTQQFIAALSSAFTYDDTTGKLTTTDQSGVVLDSQFATLFSKRVTEEGLVKEARIAALVENALSKVVITADRIRLEGYTTVNENFNIDEDGQVHMTNYIRRKQLEITPENYEIYGVFNQEYSDATGVPYYDLKITDIGTNLIFTDTADNPFPSPSEVIIIPYLPGHGMEDLSISRQYVGCRCSIGNKFQSGRQLGITGRIMKKETYESSKENWSFYTVIINYGFYYELECVRDTDINGIEMIFWVARSHGILADITR